MIINMYILHMMFIDIQVLENDASTTKNLKSWLVTDKQCFHIQHANTFHGFPSSSFSSPLKASLNLKLTHPRIWLCYMSSQAETHCKK